MHRFNPIPAVATEILRESWLLFLDEFQVTDIGDAMIIRHLFKELFNGGIVLMATSNRAPDDLYKNGLQRANFLPFIPMLKKQCQVLQLNTGVDYRRLVAEVKGVSDDSLVGSGHLQVSESLAIYLFIFYFNFFFRCTTLQVQRLTKHLTRCLKFFPARRLTSFAHGHLTSKVEM